VSKLQEYFYIDWSVMIVTDWFGMVFTVIIFVLMLVAYIWVFNPKNKDKIESNKTMPLDDDEINSEKRDGR
jgi:cytochrome c oxidase cbb3-type subunit 4